MHPDAYVVWRYLLTASALESDLSRRLCADKDWGPDRSQRAVKRATGAGWVIRQAAKRVDPRDGKSYDDWMLTAREEPRRSTQEGRS